MPVRLLWRLCIAALLAACAPATPSATVVVTLIGPEALPTSDLSDPVLLTGKTFYDRYCAHCHGYSGEGQIGQSAEDTRAQGMKVVPAHDSSGSVWRYADQVLLKVTKEGIINALNRYPMPSFSETMTDDEIMAVYDYIKTWWTPEQRAYQAEVTRKLQRIWDELGVNLTPEAPFATVTPSS